jgi:hypothetical protein
MNQSNPQRHGEGYLKQAYESESRPILTSPTICEIKILTALRAFLELHMMLVFGRSDLSQGTSDGGDGNFSM